MSMPPLGKLTRAQMEKLLSDCFKEQRPPTINELCIPMPKKCRISYQTDRTGTGLFDILDDDTLAEVLFRLPIGMRIVFAKSLCKQFAALAYEHKVFKAMYISPCGGHYGDTNETRNNMLRTVGNWSFLTMGSRSISPSLSMTVDSQIEELKLHEGRGRTVDLPPTLHLQCLTKLTLSCTSAPTMKLVRMRIDPSKLKELTLSTVKGTNDSIALLKASRNLERLSLCDLPSFDMSKIIDDWCKVHKGFPPLRFLSIDSLGRHVTMRDLEKLDIDEMYCGHIPEKIGKGQLPSMRTLRMHIYNYNAMEKVPSMKTLVASCPELLKLTLIKHSWESNHDNLTLVADAMKVEFPHLDVEVRVD
jgi:hypothetical protein